MPWITFCIASSVNKNMFTLIIFLHFLPWNKYFDIQDYLEINNKNGVSNCICKIFFCIFGLEIDLEYDIELLI